MTASLVVDASFAVRLILPGADQPAYQRQASRWTAEGIELVAPTLWLYEMTSALSKVVRSGDLEPDEARAALDLTLGLGLHLVPPDEALARSAFEWTLRLGRGAAYDSFYLALAERLGCALWTADRRLRNAVDLPWLCGIDSEIRT
jgi:predicted nucleic acid-binding protein